MGKLVVNLALFTWPCFYFYSSPRKEKGHMAIDADNKRILQSRKGSERESERENEQEKGYVCVCVFVVL